MWYFMNDAKCNFYFNIFVLHKALRSSKNMHDDDVLNSRHNIVSEALDSPYKMSDNYVLDRVLLSGIL